MRYVSQRVRLFHLSNLFVLRFHFILQLCLCKRRSLSYLRAMVNILLLPLLEALYYVRCVSTHPHPEGGGRFYGRQVRQPPNWSDPVLPHPAHTLLLYVKRTTDTF